MKMQEVFSLFGRIVKRRNAVASDGAPPPTSPQAPNDAAAPVGEAAGSGRAVGVFVFLCVFALGLAVTAYTVRGNIRASAAAQNRQLQESAASYSSALQRLLDLYLTSSIDLAAFAAASESLSGRAFERYVQASRPFERLPGLRAVGYLPLVHKSNLTDFEKQMRAEYPGFRVWGQRLAEDVYYPLAYAVNPADPLRAQGLRGFDYSTIIEREEAITRAVLSGRPQATLMHNSVADPSRERLVLLFTPVARDNVHPATPPDGPAIKGVVFSVLFVDEIFRAFDSPQANTTFDLEAFENVVHRSTLLYDGDGQTRGIHPDKRSPLVRADTLSMAGVQWRMFLYQRHPPSAISMILSQAATLVAGLLASLLAGYLAWRLWRHYRALARVASQAGLFASFFNNHPFAVFSLDRHRRFVAANAQAEKELGVPSGQLLGAPVEQFLSEENDASTRGYFEQALGGQAVSYHNRTVGSDGVQNDLSVVLVPMTTDGVVTSVLGIAKNITARKVAEHELHRARQTLQLILHTIPHMVFWKGADGVYQGANRRMLEFAGLQTVDQILGKTDHDMPWRQNADQHAAEDREIASTRVAVRRQEELNSERHERVWLEFNKVPLLTIDDKVECILGVVEDVTERKGAEVELFMRANYDALTGVANRSYFYDHLERVLAKQQRQSQPLALFHLDIDNFKHINDVHGHDTGDRVLAEFAGRVSKVIRPSDLFARFGGDEFVLLVEQVEAEESLRALADRLLAAMRPPFMVQGKSLNVRASLGIAMYRAGMGADDWVRKADEALYEAKRGGRDGYWFASGPGTA